MAYHKIGILAYGSLIENPGKEISEIEIQRIICETPFTVEFARTSSTRSGAPTLIPYPEGGQKVKAVIIVVQPTISVEALKSIIWRRELHKKNNSETYKHSEKPNKNKVIVQTLSDFMNVETVLYTSIGSNIAELTADVLANLAVKSILSEAGKEEKDGLRYLLSAIRNGIDTPLCSEYENKVLQMTGSKTLEEAIEKFDRKRLMYPSN